MNRRDLLILSGVAAVRPRTVLAQQSEKTYRLGFLGFGARDTSTIEGLGAGLGRRGYSVGNNLLIEARYAEGRLDRLPGLVKELIDIPVDVIASPATPPPAPPKTAPRPFPSFS